MPGSRKSDSTAFVSTFPPVNTDATNSKSRVVSWFRQLVGTVLIKSIRVVDAKLYVWWSGDQRLFKLVSAAK